VGLGSVKQQAGFYALHLRLPLSVAR